MNANLRFDPSLGATAFSKGIGRVFSEQGVSEANPTPGLTGTESYTAVIEDSFSVDDTTLLSTENQAPVAEDDTVDARLGITLGSFNMLDNDSDPDGDPIQVVGFSYLGAGSLSVFSDGQFAYTPAPGFTGTDTFTYTIADSFGAMDSATVFLDVGQQPTVVSGTAMGGNIRGTDGSDVLLMGGARTAQMYGGLGEDIFAFGETRSNGIKEQAFIRDYEVGVDSIDLFGAQVAAVKQTGNSLRLTLDGDDGDTLIIVGVKDFSQLTFTDEWSTL